MNKQQSTYASEWRRKNYLLRRAALCAFLGGKCKICGTTENLLIRRLPGQPRVKIQNLWCSGRETWAAIAPFVELVCQTHRAHAQSSRLKHGAPWAALRKQCQCRACSMYREQHPRPGPVHGTRYSAYEKKCRCAVCRDFMQQYNEKRQQEREKCSPQPSAQSTKNQKPRPKLQSPTIAPDLVSLADETMPAPVITNTRAPHGSFHSAVNLGCRCRQCAKFMEGV